jgi:hypothetical protein
MVTFNEMQVQDIMQDDELSREAKVARLQAIEAEARDLQRSATEGPMNADDGWDADLREVRLALDKLGAEQSHKGAASL